MFFLLFAPNVVTFLSPFGSLLSPLGSTWLPLWPPGTAFASLWSPFGPPWTLYWAPGALPWPAFGPNTSPSGVRWDPKAPFWSRLGAFFVTFCTIWWPFWSLFDTFLAYFRTLVLLPRSNTLHVIIENRTPLSGRRESHREHNKYKTISGTPFLGKFGFGVFSCN